MKGKTDLAVSKAGRKEMNEDPDVNVSENSLPGLDEANVNHPAHYTYGTIEVIDAIEGLELSYHLGNAVKYIARAGRKDPSKTTEDLYKAIWYIKRYIDFMERRRKGESDAY